jgi:hypothetical protein
LTRKTSPYLYLYPLSCQHEEAQAARAAREAAAAAHGAGSAPVKRVSAASSQSVRAPSMSVSALSGAAASFFFGNPQAAAAATGSGAIGGRSGLGSTASRRGDAGPGGAPGAAAGGGAGGGTRRGKGKGMTEVESVEEDYEDREEAHLLQKTGQRIEGVRRETEQLYHAMSGAGIFFKKSDLE